MTTKLTVTIDNIVTDSTKRYARLNGKSLSDIGEKYLKSVSTSDDSVQALSPRVTKLMGFVKLPEDFDYKKELSKILKEKHG